MKISEYATELLANDNFKAGSGIFCLIVGTAVLRKSTQAIDVIFRRYCTMTLEIPSYDKSYPWVSQWVSRHSKATHISVTTEFNRTETGKIEAEYQFIPSPGIHYLYHKGRIIRAERSRTQPTMASSAGATPFESLTLSTYGKNQLFYQNLLTDAKDYALKMEKGWTMVYKAAGDYILSAEWRPFGYPRTRRPLNSVILNDNIAQKILYDVREFQDNQQWYKDRGVPYRRGYLLYGPPGCGKSSFIAALAGELEYSICVLSLAEMGMSGDRLDYLLAHAPLQSVILLEDVDAAFGDRRYTQDKSAYQGMTGLTLSGLLNALDGVASTEGRLLFMTTNYPERLDEALIRPGRVDYKICLGLCSTNQLERLFMKFYPLSEVRLAEKFAAAIGPDRVSPALIQGFLLGYKNSPIDALDNIAELFFDTQSTPASPA